MKKYIWLFLLSLKLFSYTKFQQEIIRPLPSRNEIPKIIHQIWIGPNPIPKGVIKFMESWKKIHPTWEYRLWTNKDIETFDWIHKDVFDECTNYGMKSDIWRYEILNKYGGIYVDVDFQCIKPFDLLVEKLTFFACYNNCRELKKLNSPHNNTINGALLAASPNHPLIQKLLTHIEKRKDTFIYGNTSFDNFVFCGPYALSINLPLLEEVDVENGWYILPWEITHPIPPKLLKVQREKNFKHVVKRKYPNCMAIHYHATTWQYTKVLD